MNTLIRHIPTGERLHQWLVFCTQWSLLNTADQKQGATRSMPPDLCALAFWSEAQLDGLLQPLDLLACGSQLRSMSAGRFRERYPNLQPSHLRWALQQWSFIESECASTVNDAAGASTEDPGQFISCCTTEEGRRSLFWCDMAQRLGANAPALAEMLYQALALSGQQLPSNPNRVWLPHTAWDKLLEMSLFEGEVGAFSNGAQPEVKGAEAFGRRPMKGLSASSPAENEILMADAHESAMTSFNGNARRHAANSMQDIDRVRA